MEQRGSRTDGFKVLDCKILGAEKAWSLCGTDVLNRGGLCATEEYSVMNYESHPNAIIHR